MSLWYQLQSLENGVVWSRMTGFVDGFSIPTSMTSRKNSTSELRLEMTAASRCLVTTGIQRTQLNTLVNVDQYEIEHK